MPHINTRTWPYGTIKAGIIVDIYKNATQSVAIVRCPSDPGEAFVLMFGPRHLDGFCVKQEVQIVFTKGGPIGAHWEIFEIDSVVVGNFNNRGAADRKHPSHE